MVAFSFSNNDKDGTPTISGSWLAIGPLLAMLNRTNAVRGLGQSPRARAANL